MSIPESYYYEFLQYLEYYPSVGEKGYDGIHDGGVKGFKKGTPKSAKKKYEEYLKQIEQAKKRGIKL